MSLSSRAANESKYHRQTIFRVSRNFQRMIEPAGVSSVARLIGLTFPCKTQTILYDRDDCVGQETNGTKSPRLYLRG